MIIIDELAFLKKLSRIKILKFVSLRPKINVKIVANIVLFPHRGNRDLIIFTAY